MGQFSIAIDNAHTAPQSALDCGPGLGHNKYELTTNISGDKT